MRRRRRCGRCRRRPARNALACSREQSRVAERRERGDAEAIALAVEHAERRRADRSGRAEDRDACGRASRGHDGADVSSQPKQTYETGSTKSRLSKRSRMPPWPGNDVRAVLHARLALEQRLGEIADLRRDADQMRRRRARRPAASVKPRCAVGASTNSRVRPRRRACSRRARRSRLRRFFPG